MMYKCMDCGREFDRPIKYIERHGLDTPPYEEFYGCPYCGGSFDEVYDTDEDEEESEDEGEEDDDGL